MSDNHRRYRSIRTALAQMYFQEPKGYTAKQVNVLAALISGIVGSRRTNYPQIASKAPDPTQLESRVKRFSRYINEVEVAPRAAGQAAPGKRCQTQSAGSHRIDEQACPSDQYKNFADDRGVFGLLTYTRGRRIK